MPFMCRVFRRMALPPHIVHCCMNSGRWDDIARFLFCWFSGWVGGCIFDWLVSSLVLNSVEYGV